MPFGTSSLWPRQCSVGCKHTVGVRKLLAQSPGTPRTGDAGALKMAREGRIALLRPPFLHLCISVLSLRS